MFAASLRAGRYGWKIASKPLTTFRGGLCVFALVTIFVAGTTPAGATRVAATATTNVTVTAAKPSEFRFTLSRSTVPTGTVVFKVTNAGTLPHDFEIAGRKTKLITPGDSATLSVTFAKAGKYPYFCTVSGHAAAGMKGVLTVGTQAAKPVAVKFGAALNVAQERPHPKGTTTGASGRFTATLTGRRLKWRLTFSHLSGRATAAAIHEARRGKIGPAIVTLCTRCTSPRSGTAQLSAAKVAALKKGLTYVTVRTVRNKAGEIRGQITQAK
jgi:uncharacterized cupredoxin-like copper-binding protein